jgi:hypothetical protein
VRNSPEWTAHVTATRGGDLGAISVRETRTRELDGALDAAKPSGMLGVSGVGGATWQRGARVAAGAGRQLTVRAFLLSTSERRRTCCALCVVRYAIICDIRYAILLSSGPPARDSAILYSRKLAGSFPFSPATPIPFLNLIAATRPCHSPLTTRLLCLLPRRPGRLRFPSCRLFQPRTYSDELACTDNDHERYRIEQLFPRQLVSPPSTPCVSRYSLSVLSYSIVSDLPSSQEFDGRHNYHQHPQRRHSHSRPFAPLEFYPECNGDVLLSSKVSPGPLHPTRHVSPPASRISSPRRQTHTPTPAFESTLAKARARYGAGLGSASIRVLLPIVDLASSGELKWSEGSALEDALSIVDCDIAAAVPYLERELRRTESTTAEGEEQIAEELARRHKSAVETLRVLKEKLQRIESTASDRGCDNPFERSLDAVNAIEY